MNLKNKTLLIMAAGLGSRFGGLKQVEPVGPSGEFLIDYSIYDAIKNGFNKVIFVIKKENEQVFKQTIGKRINKFVNVEYVYQDINNLPNGYNAPERREKPWGTAHAILCAKEQINEPFVTINADDFYGNDAYKIASEYIDIAKQNRFCIVGYKAVNTLSENGSVKRGILKLNNLGKIDEIKECSVLKTNDLIVANPLDKTESFTLDNNHLVSMNMLIFNKSIFEYLEKYFQIFLNSEGKELESEFLIPDVLFKVKQDKYADIDIILTKAKWYGLTYKDDKEIVVQAIKQMIEKGIYPKSLWKVNSKSK